MTFRVVVLLLLSLAALCGCRQSPAETERRWVKSLRASMPPGWAVLVVTGDPSNNRFVGWFEAPTPAGTGRVELHVRPNAGNPEIREWSVSVHSPNPRSQRATVTFVVWNDGDGPLEVSREPADPSAIEAARPLAEEAVRQVRNLGLF